MQVSSQWTGTSMRLAYCHGECANGQGNALQQRPSEPLDSAIAKPGPSQQTSKQVDELHDSIFPTGEMDNPEFHPIPAAEPSLSGKAPRQVPMSCVNPFNYWRDLLARLLVATFAMVRQLAPRWWARSKVKAWAVCRNKYCPPSLAVANMTYGHVLRINPSPK